MLRGVRCTSQEFHLCLLFHDHCMKSGAVVSSQFLRFSFFDNFAILNDHDPIGLLQTMQTMCNQQHSTAFEWIPQHHLDGIFWIRVQARRALIDDNDFWFSKKGTRQAQQLLLPGRNVGASCIKVRGVIAANSVSSALTEVNNNLMTTRYLLLSIDGAAYSDLGSCHLKLIWSSCRFWRSDCPSKSMNEPTFRMAREQYLTINGYHSIIYHNDDNARASKPVSHITQSKYN